MSINDQRDQLRGQIRKKQIEHFSQNTNTSYLQQHLVQQLLQKQNIDHNLDAILEIFKFNYSKAKAMKLIENGLIDVIVSFLKESVYTSKILQILFFLIGKFKHQPQNLELCFELYRFNIFQILLKLLNLKMGGALSTFVLFCFSSAHQKFCKAMLQGEVYSILIGQLQYILQRCPFIEVDAHTQEYLFCIHILRTLQNLVSLNQIPLNFSCQKQQILRIVQFCLERRLFLKVIFGILYEAIQAQHPNIVTKEVADLDSNYIQNMYATIYLLTPHHSIDYSLVFKTATENFKTYKITSFILQELSKTKQLELIPTSEIFWEKMVDSSLKDQEVCKRLLKVTFKIHIQNSLSCRIIAAALEGNNSLGVQIVGLDMLESFVKQEDRIEMRLSEINKHKIPQLLNKLSKSSNSRINERAACLTDHILGQWKDISSITYSL